MKQCDQVLDAIYQVKQPQWIMVMDCGQALSAESYDFCVPPALGPFAPKHIDRWCSAFAINMRESPYVNAAKCQKCAVSPTTPKPTTTTPKPPEDDNKRVVEVCGFAEFGIPDGTYQNGKLQKRR